MSTLAARYFRARRGYLELSGVSDSARFLLAWLYQSPGRDVTPGLYRVGLAGLAEDIGWTVAKVRRNLDELEDRVLVDEEARVVFIVGAIHDDPPRNMNQITAMARHFAQIPYCAVTAAAAAELEGSIKNSEKALMDRWRELNCFGNSSRNGFGNGWQPVPTPTPTPTPIPSPIPTHTHTEGKSSPFRGRLTHRPVEDAEVNIKIITKIAHEAIDQIGENHSDPTNQELNEMVKSLCAVRDISYNSGVVLAACKSAVVQRQRRVTHG